MSVITKNYKEPTFCEKEILRYAGCKSSDDELLQLLRTCVDEIRGKLSYKVCYRELPVTISDDICDFEYMRVPSANLAKNLQGCKTVIIFGATLGVEIDRFIAKYGRISPSKALMMQAIGAERIEALCDAFCEDIAQEKNMRLKPRFSPGYGDLSLEVQKDLFGILDCAKQIGLSLNDSLLMSPSKSVTAFAGLVEYAESTNVMKTTNSVNSGKSMESASPMKPVSFMKPVSSMESATFIEEVNSMEPTTFIKDSINIETRSEINKTNKTSKCTACGKTDCEYRGVE